MTIFPRNLATILFTMIFALLTSDFAYAKIQIEARVSKVFGLICFLEAISGDSSTGNLFSSEFYELKQAKTLKATISELSSILSLLRSNAQFGKQSGNRVESVSLLDIIESQAVLSSDLQDFELRIRGVLPSNTQFDLLRVLKIFYPIYVDLVWDKSKDQIANVLSEFEVKKKEAKFEERLIKIANFYQSDISFDRVLFVNFYPLIPGSKASSAKSVGDFAFIAVDFKKINWTELLSIVAHEFSHSFFALQNSATVKPLDASFDKSFKSILALSDLNEALATAIGNGWMFKQVSGKESNSEWYNNPRIEKYARGLYPIVSMALERSESLDPNLATKIIAVYEREFPNSEKRFAEFLIKISLWSDSKNLYPKDLLPIILSHFQLSSADFHSSIDPQSTIDKNLPLIAVISGENPLLVNRLNDELSDARNIIELVQKGDWNCVIASLDVRKRPMIFIKARDFRGVEAVFKAIQRAGTIKPGNIPMCV